MVDFYAKCIALRILTPPVETPDPPNDTPGALEQVVLTPHDIPRILREVNIPFFHGSYGYHPVLTFIPIPTWQDSLLFSSEVRTFGGNSCLDFTQFCPGIPRFFSMGMKQSFSPPPHQKKWMGNEQNMIR